MPNDLVRYPIPAETTRVELAFANSRFIATIGQAQTVDEAKDFIAAMRAEFADATHNVPVYKVGYGNSITEGASDDGEPSGTAGRPALAVLRGADIGDVVLVITRYFGGTKLGTGGLVRAYTQAAQEALAVLPRTWRIETRSGLLSVPYSFYERIKLLVEATNGEILDEEFAGEVILTLSFALDHYAEFEHALTEVTSGGLEVLWEDS
ncbi:MAG: YigZ family protein [Chloroflexi bacterium]|nr:YigZ family protein [Chloroflexota bacterium]